MTGTLSPLPPLPSNIGEAGCWLGPAVDSAPSVAQPTGQPPSPGSDTELRLCALEMAVRMLGQRINATDVVPADQLALLKQLLPTSGTAAGKVSDDEFGAPAAADNANKDTGSPTSRSPTNSGNNSPRSTASRPGHPPANPSPLTSPHRSRRRRPAPPATESDESDGFGPAPAKPGSKKSPPIQRQLSPITGSPNGSPANVWSPGLQRAAETASSVPSIARGRSDGELSNRRTVPQRVTGVRVASADAPCPHGSTPRAHGTHLCLCVRTTLSAEPHVMHPCVHVHVVGCAAGTPLLRRRVRTQAVDQAGGVARDWSNVFPLVGRRAPMRPQA